MDFNMECNKNGLENILMNCFKNGLMNGKMNSIWIDVKIKVFIRELKER